MTKILLKDLRAAGIGTCPRAREWMARNGLDWRTLRDGGYTTDDALALLGGDDDAYVTRLVAAARKREASR